MLTDVELRDAAVAELKLTTTGFLKPNGQPKPPPWPANSQHWSKALALLERIGEELPPPPAEKTWDSVLAEHFPIVPFTPTRVVTCTTAAQLNAAVWGLQPGDRIDATGFTYLGSFQVRDKNLSDWAEIHFTDVIFAGSGTLDGFVLWNSSRVRCFGGEVTGGAGYGVRLFDCIDVEWRGKVHDVGGTGVHLTPSSASYPGYKSPTRNVVVVEARNCGLNHSLDPHVEKGTGLHAAYIGKSGAHPVLDCKVAVFTHDQPRCAGGAQCTNTQDSLFVIRARDLPFRATSQTAGNAFQVFSGGVLRNRFVYIDAERITGKGFASIIGGTDLSSNVVEYGRTRDYALNPHEGGAAWDTDGAMRYEDVEPQDFGV